MFSPLTGSFCLSSQSYICATITGASYRYCVYGRPFGTRPSLLRQRSM
jgi:hypothetical protein